MKKSTKTPDKNPKKKKVVYKPARPATVGKKVPGKASKKAIKYTGKETVAEMKAIRLKAKQEKMKKSKK